MYNEFENENNDKNNNSNISNAGDMDSNNMSSSAGTNYTGSPMPQDNGRREEEDERPVRQGKRRKSKIAVRIVGITAAALLFGVVAGGTMVGINMLSQYMSGITYQQAGQTEAVPSQAKEETEAPKETQEAKEAGAEASTLVAMDVSGIVEKAMPSVVAINNTMLYQSQSWFGQSQTYEVPSSGSGIIVGQNEEELLIVTNNHVVENSKSLEVVFIDNNSIPAAVKGTDADNDLAVIAVALKDIPSETMNQISVATLGSSDDLKVGQGVIAIGNALGYGQSVTVGYVSALDREVKTEGGSAKNLLQTDAAINPGNSGGALLNMKGEVIGINAAKYSSTEVEGMGYAIPISKVQNIIDDLMTKKTRVEIAEEKQGYLGIRGQDVDANMSKALGMPTGVYVTEIIEGEAAAASDLHTKDIIVKFDGQGVRNMDDLKELLSYYEAGTKVELTVQSLQNGEYQERQVEITLGKRPQSVN